MFSCLERSMAGIGECLAIFRELERFRKPLAEIAECRNSFWRSKGASRRSETRVCQLKNGTPVARCFDEAARNARGIVRCAEATTRIVLISNSTARSCSTNSTTNGRSFLEERFRGGRRRGGARRVGRRLGRPAAAQTAVARQGRPSHHYVPATADTVHWGYFSKLLKPVVEVNSGDYVTIEALTHHANDDAERMVRATGAESVYLWTKDRRASTGAAPIQ